MTKMQLPEEQIRRLRAVVELHYAAQQKLAAVEDTSTILDNLREQAAYPCMPIHMPIHVSMS